MLGIYEYINKKKEKYYLHMRGRGRRILYYFSTELNGALPALPLGFEVIENKDSGLPMLKKKAPGLFSIESLTDKEKKKKMEY